MILLELLVQYGLRSSGVVQRRERLLTGNNNNNNNNDNTVSFQNFICFCGLDPGNLKFETVRTHKKHIRF